MSDEDPAPPLPSKSILDDVVDLRRYFHKYPEVSFSEHETSRYLKDRLHDLGLDVETCPTETGAVGLLDTGHPGKTVMLRADIDALPILEEPGFDFHSLIEGIRDVAGKYLFVFQPAEEIVEGAKAMIARGLLDEHKPDYVIGLHILS